MFRGVKCRKSNTNVKKWDSIGFKLVVQKYSVRICARTWVKNKLQNISRKRICRNLYIYVRSFGIKHILGSNYTLCMVWTKYLSNVQKYQHRYDLNQNYNTCLGGTTCSQFHKIIAVFILPKLRCFSPSNCFFCLKRKNHFFKILARLLKVGQVWEIFSKKLGKGEGLNSEFSLDQILLFELFIFLLRAHTC